MIASKIGANVVARTVLYARSFLLNPATLWYQSSPCVVVFNDFYWLVCLKNPKLVQIVCTPIHMCHHFWSRLAKALQQSNISVTWAEQLDSRLATVHTTGKLSWAAATRSIRECKMIGLAAHQPLKPRHAQSLLSPLFRDPRAPHVLKTYPERAAPLPRRGGERRHAVGSHSALALCLYLAACNPYSCCCFTKCRHIWFLGF